MEINDRSEVDCYSLEMPKDLGMDLANGWGKIQRQTNLLSGQPAPAFLEVIPG